VNNLGNIGASRSNLVYCSLLCPWLVWVKWINYPI